MWSLTLRCCSPKLHFTISYNMNLTKLEKKLLLDAVTGCESVFEWGCGESTEIISSISSVREFFSVDSDLAWINSCKAKNLPTTNYFHVNMETPEGSWGYPGKNFDSKYFLEYPLKIFQVRHEFNVVFVDGRFRVACACAAYFKLKSDGIC